MLKEQPFDIHSLHGAYATGLSAEDVVEECHRRIAEVADPGIFIHLIDKPLALAAARALGTFDPISKPLWGVPFAIKDNIDAAGMPTTAACPDYSYPAARNAFTVQALLDAGAILIGKTNLDQFATGLVGVRSPYPVPKNALDPKIVPGGSSSGSGVVVAHGIVTFSLGTDTAGSGRVPAALNGIVGLKPSLGAFSNTGVVPACLSLDTISVFALGAGDAYQVFRAACRFDANDAYARQIPAPALSAPPPRFRLGVPAPQSLEFFGDTVQADAFAEALGALKNLGAEIIEIDMQPFYDVARMLYDGVWVAERYTVIEELLKSKPQALHPVTKKVISAAEKYSAVDTFRAQYRLQALKRDIAPVLAGIDVLCVPSIPTFYSCADLDADPIGPNARLGTYTNFVNLLDMCGIAVPTMPRRDGRPGSVTLLAASGRDSLTAGLADRLQRLCAAPLGATAWTLPPAESAADAPGADDMAIAVVGAHMSGLPLNGELTRLGGRFLRAAKTAPIYRLYKLAGGPPARPGLVRGEGGAAIDLEIWALPASRFGAFVAGVPHPLGIGTLHLDTGEDVKGFICEPCGIVGAEDVTHFGGWRKYLNSIPSAKNQTKESSHVQT